MNDHKDDPPLCISDTDLRTLFYMQVHYKNDICVNFSGIQLRRVGNYWFSRTHPMYPTPTTSPDTP